LKVEKVCPISDKKDMGHKPKKTRIVYGESFEEILLRIVEVEEQVEKEEVKKPMKKKVLKRKKK